MLSIASASGRLLPKNKQKIIIKIVAIKLDFAVIGAGTCPTDLGLVDPNFWFYSKSKFFTANTYV